MKELDEKMTAVKSDSIISAALSAGALNMSKETMKRAVKVHIFAV